MLKNFKNSLVRASFVALLFLAPVPNLHSADAVSINLPASQSAAVDGNAGYGDRLKARQEILGAITDDLARKGISWGSELRVDDLTIQASMTGMSANGTLRVDKIRVDAYRNRLVFELCAPNRPRFLPFAVTTPLDQALISGLAGLRGDATGMIHTQSPIASRTVVPPFPKALVLARPGTLATLFMVRPNARITTTVIPLQSGAKGQSILVRDPASARVMTAVVIDQNLLQASF